jgi:hypothetical protein
VTWSVEAEGYRPSHGVLGGLTRGETRSVAIRLEREVEAPKTHARVKGRVVSPEGFPHRRPVLVVLARAAPSSRLELRLELPTDAGWNDIDNVLTQSSTYEFVAREPGVYRIQALSGGGSVATSGLFHVADSTPIDVPILTVPEERIVRGALTVPLGYEADGGRLLWLRHETKPETQSAESRWFERYVVGLTVDTSSGGAFEVKGLSDGEYDIHLTRVRSAGAPLPTELTFGAVILGTVAIHGGDVEGVRLAVPSEALTRVRIEVRAGGAPLSFAALQVTSLDGERVQWLTCDAEGIATVGPIPSGAMNVFVYNLEGGWRYRGELSHTCAGPRSTVTIDLPLTTTLLTLVDDKEAKLANKVVNVLAEFGPGSPHYFDSILRIGPAGQLELRVPAAPGRIRVFHTSGQAQIDFDTIPPAEATLVVK